MRRLRNRSWCFRLRFTHPGGACVPTGLVSTFLAAALLAYPLPRALKDKTTLQPPTVRWSEQQPGCTFSRGDDGKYRYGLWSGDVGLVLAVDAREVQLIRHRREPVFAVLLEIHYRGATSLDASADAVTLQFVKHFKVVQTSLDPDDYIQKIQADADAFDDTTRREVAKHPEKKQAQEAR